LTDHDRVGKEVVDHILKKFKEGKWKCLKDEEDMEDVGKDFYRTGTPKTHPSPDHAFADDTNKIMVTFEYKPPLEKKRGVLTGLGQAIAYLNKSDISYLVIPKKLDTGYDIESQMTEIIGRQIVGNLPMGLIVFDNDVPSKISMIHNVDSLLDRDKVKQKYTGRFWAKYVDLPIPLFHLILHYYYLVKIKEREGDPLALCWTERMLKSSSLETLTPNVIKDTNDEIIRTMDDSKDKMYFDKKFAKANQLTGQERTDEIAQIMKDSRTDVQGDNTYNSVMGKNIKPFLEHLGVIGDGELTDLGVKLYHLGLTNGPKSKIFRDYFLKCVLEQGRHLDLIFDLERLCKKYRGEKTTDQIRSIMEEEYEANGMVKRNPNRVVGEESNTPFLKDNFILWGTRGNALGIKEKIEGKPDLAFNWEKITEVRALPEL
jgi:hypothetical protein